MKQSVRGGSSSNSSQLGKTISICAPTEMGRRRISAVIILVVYILGTSSSLAAEIPAQYKNDSLAAENQVNYR